MRLLTIMLRTISVITITFLFFFVAVGILSIFYLENVENAFQFFKNIFCGY